MRHPRAELAKAGGAHSRARRRFLQSNRLRVERALPNDTACGRRRIGAVAPNAVEAVVVAVEPERVPAFSGRTRPGGADFIGGTELAVDDVRADVTYHGRTGLRAFHRPGESAATAGALHVPRSGGGDRRGRQHLVGDERAVSRTAVVAPGAVEAVAVRAGVHREPSSAGRAVPLAIDLGVVNEFAGEPGSV